MGAWEEERQEKQRQGIRIDWLFNFSRSSSQAQGLSSKENVEEIHGEIWKVG